MALGTGLFGNKNGVATVQPAMTGAGEAVKGVPDHGVVGEVDKTVDPAMTSNPGQPKAGPDAGCGPTVATVTPGKSGDFGRGAMPTGDGYAVDYTLQHSAGK